MEHRQTLPQWFPDHGKFRQGNRTLATLRDASAGKTVRHHPDTIQLDRATSALRPSQAASLETATYTREEVDRLMMPPPH